MREAVAGKQASPRRNSTQTGDLQTIEGGDGGGEPSVKDIKDEERSDNGQQDHGGL